MEIKNIKKRIFVLIILLVMFFVIYYAEGEIINSTKSEITKSSLNLTRVENERDSAIVTLNLIQSQLEKNNSELQQLKSGDIYHLHDPTMQEVTDFISTSEDAVIGESPTKMINSSKNQGIRCAYVIVYMINVESRYLIGFDTIDEGMIYFEWGVFKAIPKIGVNYNECVLDTNYKPGKTDIISDIVVIW
ncbi:MAG: hypothetical protein MUO82_08465 [Candidatus Thermoplasmatota archaeon]|nr:hypothetical protein [Candidatus Thermoplasmatota archaeon]